MKPHPVDDATAAAIASADHFVVSLFHGGAHESHPLSTLAQAREAGDMLEQLRGGSRRAIVYAVTKEGRSFMVPRDFPAPTKLTEPSVMLNPVRSYSDRSNASAAARRALGDKAKIGVDYHVVPAEGQTSRFIWNAGPAAPAIALKTPAHTPAPEAGKGETAVDLTRQLAQAEADGSVPAFLRIPAEQRKAAHAQMGALMPAATAAAKRSDAGKSAGVREAEAKLKKTAKEDKPAAPGQRARYDWSGHEERAKAGHMPPKLDFSADTHARFRPTLAELEKLAAAGDAAGLAKVKINVVSSSPKAMDRWRKMAIAAIKSKSVPKK